MPISVDCDVCGASFRVKDSVAGRVIPCKECRADVKVANDSGGNSGGRSRGRKRSQERRRPDRSRSRQGRSTAADFDVDYGDDFRPSASKKSASGDSNKVGYIVMGILGSVVVIGGVIYGVVFNANGNPDPVVVNNGINPNLNPDQAQFVNGVQQFQNGIARNINNQIGNIPNIQNRPPFGNNRPPARPIQPVKPPEPVEETRWNFQANVPVQVNDRAASLPEVSTGFLGVVYHARNHGDVIAIGGNRDEKDSLKLIDLSTGQVKGEIAGKQEFGRQRTLSTDGKLLATDVRDNRFKYTIKLFSFETGQEQSTLGLDYSSHEIKSFFFAGQDKLVVVRDKFFELFLLVYDIKSGAQLREIAIPKNQRFQDDKQLIATHDGKYLLAYGNRLRAYDLNSGEMVGSMEIPRQIDRDRWKSEGFYLSPDGTEAALLLERHRKARLYIVDVQTGKAKHDFDFNKSISDEFGNAFFHRKMPRVQWMTNGKGWLVMCKNLVDRASGQVQWKVPSGFPLEGDTIGILNDNMFFGLKRGPRGTKLLATAHIPDEETRKLLSTTLPRNPSTPPGGREPQTEDLKLPVLKPVDLKLAQKLTLPADEQAWNVSLKPEAGVVRRLTKDPVVISRSRYVKVLFSDRQSAKAVVLHTPQNPHLSNRPSKAASGRYWLESYDLNDGNSLGRLDVPLSSELLGISPSGELAVLRIGKDGERLDIWNVKTGKHQLSIEPYSTLETQVRAQSSSGSVTEKTVRSADFLDENHIVTANSEGGKIVLWNLADAKAVYRIDSNSTNPVFLTPDRKFLCVFDGHRLRLLNAQTGTVKGDLPIPFDSSTMQVKESLITFSPDRKKLAIAAKGPAISVLLHWDLETGKFSSEFPLTGSGRSLEWCSPTHLIFSAGEETYLVDIKRNAIVWRYSLENATLVGRSPDDRQWAVISSADFTHSNLAPLQFSDERVLSEVDETFPSDLPPLVSPGTAVSLDIDSVTGPNNLKGRFQEKITQIFATNGLTVAPDQPVKLIASMEAGKSETVQYERIRSFGGSGGPGNFSITTQETICRVAFVNEKNETLWERRTSVGGGSFGNIVHFPANENPSSYFGQIQSEMKISAAESFFTSITIPRTIYPQPVDEYDRPGLGFRLIDLRDSIKVAKVNAAGLTLVAQKRYEAVSREFLYTPYANVLKENEAAWNQKIQWSPLLKRPIVAGVRVGFSAELVTRDSKNPVIGMPAKASTARTLGKDVGPVGKLIFEGLKSRQESGKLGTWPDFRDGRVEEVTLITPGTLVEIVTAGRKMGLDALLVLNFQKKRIDGETTTLLQVYLYDLHQQTQVWVSEKLDSQEVADAKKTGRDLIAPFATNALRIIDTQLVPKPLQRITPSQATDRVTFLEESTTFVNPLATLLELRLLRKENQISAGRAVAISQKILDSFDGRLFIEGTSEERKTIIEKRFPELVEKEPATPRS